MFKIQIYCVMADSSLFRNKSFMLDEMTSKMLQNLPYFIYIYENSKLVFHFSFRLGKVCRHIREKIK